MSLPMTSASATNERGRVPISAYHKVKLTFLLAAFVSFVLSVFLWFSVDRELGIFVGLWVPAIHSLGVLVLVGEDSSS